MKKILSLILAVCLLLSLGITASAVEITTRDVELYYRQVSIVIDGKQLIPTDVNGNATEPFIIDGTTYLPVRAVANALGLKVEWLAASSTIKLSSGGEVNYGSGEAAATKRIVKTSVGYRGITIQLDGKTLALKDVNGKTVEPFILGGTTYVPVRAIANALGLEVDWNGAASAVILSTGKVWLPSLVSISQISALGGQGTTATMEYSYDDDTGAPTTLRYKSTDRSYTASVSYDEDDRITKLSVSGAGINRGFERKYNELGLLSYEKNWEGSSYTALSYTYNEDGLLTAMTETEYRSGSSTRTQYTYSYDKEGLLIKEIRKTGSEEVSIVYAYNRAGSLILEVITSDPHTLKTVYSYDEAGNLSSIVYYDCDNEYSSYTYSYDDKGNMLAENYSHLDFSSSTIYSYDDRSRLVSQSYIDTDGLSYTSTTGYDRYGYTAFYRLDESGKSSFGDYTYFEELSYEYSPGGNLLYRSRTDSNGSSSTFSGEYDALDRLTSSTTTSNGNTGYYTAQYELGLWPVYIADANASGMTTTRVEYQVFESGRWLAALEEIHDFLGG